VSGSGGNGVAATAEPIPNGETGGAAIDIFVSIGNGRSEGTWTAVGGMLHAAGGMIGLDDSDCAFVIGVYKVSHS